jgi:hypothetical protein
MAALLLAPREQWWMYLAAIVPFHLFAQLLDQPLAQVIIQYIANVGLAALGALAILTISPTPHRFDRVRSAFTLVLFGGLLAPALTSILMATAFVLCGISHEVRLTMVARTITNTFAVVTLVPLIVHCAERLRSGQRPISVKRAAEAVTLALTVRRCIPLFFLLTSSPHLPAAVCAATVVRLGHRAIRRLGPARPR